MLKALTPLLIVLSVATVSEAQLYFVHGINGREVQSPQSNPYDISLNGECILKGINYQQISAPIKIPPGHYLVEARDADGYCTGNLNVTGTFDVALNESLSTVAHLNEQGVPTITKFSNDPRDTKADKARLVIRHSAGVEPITIRLRRLTRGSSLTFGGYLPPINSGAQQALELQSGRYRVTFYSTVGYKQKLLSTEVTLDDNKLRALYPVGSLNGRNFAIIVQNLDTVR